MRGLGSLAVLLAACHSTSTRSSTKGDSIGGGDCADGDCADASPPTPPPDARTREPDLSTPDVAPPAPDRVEIPDTTVRDAAVAHDAARDPSSGALGGSLDGLVFSVECPMRTTDGQCNIPDATRIKTSAPVQLGGDPGVTYHVRLHFCGPVEGRKYAGCARTTFTNDGLLCMDGTPVAMSASDQYVDTYPTYELKVSAPAHSYFVNSRDLRDTLMKIDYSADLEVRGGASLTFSTTSRGEITFTSRQLQPPITCPGVPGLQQPFDGQFIHVTVESAVPE
jgi:hypothetical protein